MPKHPLGVYQNRPTGTDEAGQKGLQYEPQRSKDHDR